MVVVDTHRHLIATVVTVVVVVHMEYQGAQSFGVCIIIFFLFNILMLCVFLCSGSSFLLLCCCAVLVTGLPSSASWQDLKVVMIFHLEKSYFVGCSNSGQEKSCASLDF